MWIAVFHLIIFILPFVLTFGVYATNEKRISRQELQYHLLLSFLFFCVGIQGLVTGVVQITGAEGYCVYHQRAWSPFVWELGMMNLSYGVLGIMCFWLRGPFWAAVGIGYSIFLTLAFSGHVYESIVNPEYHFRNFGLQTWIDLGIALIIFYLIFSSKKHE